LLSAPVRMLVHAKMKIAKTHFRNVMSYKTFITGKGKKVSIESQANRPAVLLSTSGSTGIPKKVVLTNRNINSIAVQYKVSGMNINRNDKFIAMAPPFHAFGISLGIHLPLCCGVLCIISTDPSPDKSAELFAKYNPNLFLGAVDHIIKIIENPDVNRLDLSDLHTIAVGGETMSDKLRDDVNAFLKAHNVKGKLVTGYGMSELAGTAVTEKTGVWRDGSVGIPQSLVTVKIVDINTNEECKYGVEGEILISSPAMMQEYVNNQEETVKAIEVDVNGTKWIHTGDLGYIDEDGFVFVKGRLKRIYTTLDMVTGQTYKLFPDYIESELDKIPFVSRSAVLVIEDDTRMHVAVAFLRMKEIKDNWEEETVHILKKELPAYDIPVKFFIVNDLPLLSSGKVDYRKLEEMYSL
ncbi:MAG: long-chain fatty acid--CoA ligase, partial [Lachnospiraceae bacterium]|nr:long-chain fatty acid--CoA ligase [Lachnospiraceae bacterium]